MRTLGEQVTFYCTNVIKYQCPLGMDFHATIYLRSTLVVAKPTLVPVTKWVDSESSKGGGKALKWQILGGIERLKFWSQMYILFFFSCHNNSYYTWLLQLQVSNYNWNWLENFLCLVRLYGRDFIMIYEAWRIGVFCIAETLIIEIYHVTGELHKTLIIFLYHIWVTGTYKK